MITRYKCRVCHLIFSEKDLVDGACVCGNKNVEKMCPYDHICTCTHDIQEGIRYCAECGKPICICGSHDVGTISRVTGYLSEVSGWNKAKQQELKDRHRVTV